MLTVAIPKRNKLQNIIVLTPKDGGAVLITVAVSFGVIWGTVKVSLSTLKKQNIVEVIRTL